MIRASGERSDFLSVLKEQYGNKAGERLKYLAKKAGFKSAALSETEACVLLDLLNSEERANE